MFLDQSALIHCSKLTFLHNKFSVDNGVVRIDGLPEHHGRDRIVHTSEAELVQVDGEEVGALASFEAADVSSAQYRCAAACAKMQGIAGGHQFSVWIVGKGIAR